MTTTRRGFFGRLCAALAAPFVGRLMSGASSPKPILVSDSICQGYWSAEYAGFKAIELDGRVAKVEWRYVGFDRLAERNREWSVADLVKALESIHA